MKSTQIYMVSLIALCIRSLGKFTAEDAVHILSFTIVKVLTCPLLQREANILSLRHGFDLMFDLMLEI